MKDTKTRLAVAPKSVLKMRGNRPVLVGDSLNQDARPAASQEDSKTTGKRHGREVTESVRRQNDIHRDDRTRLGRQKASSVVTE